jgi:hypothetical protein
MASKMIVDTKNIICIDDEYFDVDQISFIGKIEQTNYHPKEEVFAFSVMLTGHSNSLIFESNSMKIAYTKRNFILQAWIRPGEEEDIDVYNIDDYEEDPTDETQN